ncbi:MAG: RDD family protein [Deltaproteobacteria bacterium]|nr:RDD family protein [Deltaproteobacteria bacterium]
MFCPACGQEAAESDSFCQSCGHYLKGTAPESGTYEAGIRRRAAASYAGFWLRAVAWLIDETLVYIVVVGVEATVGYISGQNLGLRSAMSQKNPFGPTFGLRLSIGTLIHWLYWAGFESSGFQATLGKMALGLKVTDLNGDPITFARATGRYFGKIISALILCIGFMMAGWTAKKQALHDLMAGTLVVKKRDSYGPS